MALFDADALMEAVTGFAELVRVGFQLYGWLIVGAFVLSWVDADRSNSIVQFVERSTRPFWNWIANRLPVQYALFAPLIAIFAVDFAEIFFPGAIRSLGAVLVDKSVIEEGVFNLLLYSGLASLIILRRLMFFVMILSVAYFVLSLVGPPLTSPLVRSVTWLISPLITPLQRLLPRAKYDLSPVVLAIGLYFILQFIAPWIFDLQRQLTS